MSSKTKYYQVENEGVVFASFVDGDFVNIYAIDSLNNEYQWSGTAWLPSKVGGAKATYGLARNLVRQTAGIYNTTEVKGFWVEAQPSADDTAITPIDGIATTAIDAVAFVEGQFYPVHASAITVGTGGSFLLVI